VRASSDIISQYSDQRLKNILGPINNALGKLNSINGVYYKPNKLANDIASIENTGRQIGVIAQEVEKVLPEIISIAPFDLDKYGGSKSGQQYLTVIYERLIPLLVEALKAQKDQIDFIKQKLEA
jgi:hypothetical protein